MNGVVLVERSVRDETSELAAPVKHSGVMSGVREL